MNVANLFARIGLKADNEKAGKFLDQIKNISIGMIGASVSAVALVNKLRQITEEALASANAMKQFRSETGADTTQLQQWQQVAEQVNISADSVTNAIKSIADNTAKIKLGQGNISGYQLLGINPNQDPFKIMEDLRTKTEGLSQSMKKNILSQMGIGSELIQILDLSKEKFKELSSSAFVLSPQAIDTMNQADSSLKMISQAVNYLKSQIVVALSPSITILSKQIGEWIKQNKDGLTKTIKDVFDWVTRFVGAISNVIKIIDMAVKNTIGWKNAMLGLIAIIVVLNSALIFSPIGLFIAGIILLVAILDDFYRYSEGKRSLFGIFMKNYPELKKVFDEFLGNAKDVLGLLVALFKDDEDSIGKYAEKMGDLAKATKTFYDALVFVKDIISGIFAVGLPDFGGMFKKLDWFSGLMSGKLSMEEYNKLNKEEFERSSKKFFEGLTDFLTKYSPLGYINKNTNSTNNVNITNNVNTSADGKQLIEEIDRKAGRQLNNVSQQIGRMNE